MLQISQDDLAQQLWFVHASLTALVMGEEHAHKPDYKPSLPQAIKPQDTVNRECLLAAAAAVADRLEWLALRGDLDASWLGVTLVSEKHWSLVPLGPDLYNGLPGVALFLAYAGAITGQERYTDLARRALTTWRRQMEQARPFLKPIGTFGGWGGAIYTLAHLGTLWDQPDLLAEAEGIVDLLPDLIRQDETFDVISGSAGCIGSLLVLHHCVPSERALAAAIQCGDRLIAGAQPMPCGIGWPNQHAKSPLTGFSHGAAGVAWALLELAALTGEERFRATALAAMAYERSVFSPEAGNWPDLRDFKTGGQKTNNGQEGEKFMTAWCHGAPGIGLARLRALQHLDDSEIRAEIDAAIKTTLAHGFGGNHSLCHGDLGNLELLLQAGEILDPQWQAQTYRIGAMILESISEHGWLCGVPLGVETPGLMTGLAGIGYELLRLAEPARVPSVLALAPPRL